MQLGGCGLASRTHQLSGWSSTSAHRPIGTSAEGYCLVIRFAFCPALPVSGISVYSKRSWEPRLELSGRVIGSRPNSIIGSSRWLCCEWLPDLVSISLDIALPFVALHLHTKAVLGARNISLEVCLHSSHHAFLPELDGLTWLGPLGTPCLLCHFGRFDPLSRRARCVVCTL